MAFIQKRKRKSTSNDDEPLRNKKLVDRIEQDLKSCEDRGKWIEEAKRCEEFRNGHQWEDEDKDLLREQKRPSITFNLTRRVIDAIVGTEIQHRQRILFLPRQPNKPDVAAAADLATDAVDWAIERSKGTHERSLAFRDAAIRGVGCVGYRLDYETDPDGQLAIERVDSYEMWWDPAARAANLEDAKWVARKRKWRIEDIREEFGKDLTDQVVSSSDLGRSIPLGSGDDGSSYTKVLNLQSNVFGGIGQRVTPGTPSEWRKGEAEVVEFQWYEKEKFYRVLERAPAPPAPPEPGMEMPGPQGPMDATAQMNGFGPGVGQSTAPGMTAASTPPPSAGAPPGMLPPGGAPPTMAPPPPPEPQERWVSFSTSEYDDLLERHRMAAEMAIGRGEEPPPPPAAVKQTRRKYKQAFIANGVLLREDDHWHDGITYNFITWDWDPKERVWFGLIRDLIDPQKAVNKWVAQGIHHFNSSAKGAVLVEPNAVVNPATLPTDWAKPSAIIHVNTGAIASKKIEVVPSQPLPEAVTTMTQYAMQALQQIPGVNVELLGASEGDEPGVTVSRRQAQGLTILAPLFDALTRFRLTEAKTVFRIVKKYLSDGRLIRIGDAHDIEYRALLQEDFAEDYDLVIDDAPRDPNAKRLVWEMLQSVLPLIVRQNGDLPDALKDYMPLPASAIAELKKEAAMKAQQPPPPPKKDENPEWIAAEIALTRAQAELASARAKAILQQAGMGTAETAQDMVLEKKRFEQESKSQDRELSIAEDENTLNALDTLKRDLDPDVPGVRAG